MDNAIGPTTYSYDVLVYSLAFVLSTACSYAGLIAARRPGSPWVLLATSVVCASIGTGCIGVICWRIGVALPNAPGWISVAVLLAVGGSIFGARSAYYLVVSRVTGIPYDELRRMEEAADALGSFGNNDSSGSADDSDRNGMEGSTSGEPDTTGKES